MLSKRYCLKKENDFKSIFKNGKPCNGNLLFLKFKKNNLQISRFGFIVSKKISKKATTRNKIKRRLREIVRKNLDNIKQGFDIVIWTKEEILDKNYQEIEKGMKELLKKANLL